MSTTGIPTEYAGTQFRSRLEARWAVFMDLIGWKWEYEPYDLKGYIPDFLVFGENPLLVEVKPVSKYAEAEHIAKCVPLPDGSEHVVLVVGVSPFLTCDDRDCAGAITQWWPAGDDEPAGHDPAPAIWTDTAERAYAVVHHYGAWIPYPEGRHKPGLTTAGETALEHMWTHARNFTQWRAA